MEWVHRFLFFSTKVSYCKQSTIIGHFEDDCCLELFFLIESVIFFSCLQVVTMLQ